MFVTYETINNARLYCYSLFEILLYVITQYLLLTYDIKQIPFGQTNPQIVQSASSDQTRTLLLKTIHIIAQNFRARKFVARNVNNRESRT